MSRRVERRAHRPELDEVRAVELPLDLVDRRLVAVEPPMLLVDERGRGEHELVHPVGEARGDLDRDHRAGVVADDGRALDPERVEDADGDLGPALDRVRPPSGLDESPNPIVSIAIAWNRSPRIGTTSRYSSQERGVWWRSSTGRPEPACATWIVPAGTETNERLTSAIGESLSRGRDGSRPRAYAFPSRRTKPPRCGRLRTGDRQTPGPGRAQGLRPRTGRADEPVLHEPWQGSVIAGILATIIAGLYNVDQFRAGIDDLEPLSYLSVGYYGRWLHTLEVNCVQAGVFSEEELEARLAAIGEQPDAPLPRGPTRASPTALRQPGRERRLERAHGLRAAGLRRRRPGPGPAASRRPPRPHPGRTRRAGGNRAPRPRGVRLPGHEPPGRGREPEYVYAVRLPRPRSLARRRRGRNRARRPLGELPRAGRRRPTRAKESA